MLKRTKKIRSVKDIQSYIDSPHVVRHNTVVKKLNNDFAKQIYLLELERNRGLDHLSARYLRRRALKSISDLEFIEKVVLSDFDEDIALDAVRSLRTQSSFDLLKRILIGDYPDSLRKMAKQKLGRVKNSVRFILE